MPDLALVMTYLCRPTFYDNFYPKAYTGSLSRYKFTKKLDETTTTKKHEFTNKNIEETVQADLAIIGDYLFRIKNGAFLSEIHN